MEPTAVGARLIAMHEDVATKDFDLTQLHLNEVCLIGRADACQIVIKGPYISRTHAMIKHEDGEFIIINQGQGGTFINGERIYEAYVLQDQDRIGFSTPIVMLCFLNPLAMEEFTCDRISFDSRLFQFILDGEQIPLRGKQLQLFKFLYDNRDRVCMREECGQILWGRYDPYQDEDALNRHIYKIRNKLNKIAPDEGKNILQLHRGLGYKLVINL